MLLYGNHNLEPNSTFNKSAYLGKLDLLPETWEFFLICVHACISDETPYSHTAILYDKEYHWLT